MPDNLLIGRWQNCRSTVIHTKVLSGVKYAKTDDAKYKIRLRNWIARGLPLPTRPEPKLCECCGKEFGREGTQLDHCHATHTFRGWLCRKCNTGLGMLGDSIESINAVMAYLKRHQTVNQVTDPPSTVYHGDL